MDGSFSPIVMKIAGEVAGKRKKRDFRHPTDVCLEDWWLSKPDDGNGIAVGGCPVEMRRCDIAQKESQSAPIKKRYASREFHSVIVVKRHSCTTVETSDGLFVYLCGFINRFRTQQNGFSSEVCRDFLYGFPVNWKDYATKCVDEESSSSNLEYFSECFLPAALETYSGAQLHDMVLSLTDAEREILNKRMYDNLMGTLNPKVVNGITVQPSKPIPSSVVDKDILTPSSTMGKVRNKQQKNTPLQNYNELEVGVASVSSRTTAENQPDTSGASNTVDALTSRKCVHRSAKRLENHETEENVTILSKASKKQRPVGKTATKIQTPRKHASDTVIKLNNAKKAKTVNVSPTGSVTEGAVDKPTGVTRTSRDRVCKSMNNLKHSRNGGDVIASPMASEEAAAKGKVCMASSAQVEGKETCDQSELRQLLEHLTSVGKRRKASIRMLKELLY